jgi:hypothetical protein
VLIVSKRGRKNYVSPANPCTFCRKAADAASGVLSSDFQSFALLYFRCVKEVGASSFDTQRLTSMPPKQSKLLLARRVEATKVAIRRASTPNGSWSSEVWWKRGRVEEG